MHKVGIVVYGNFLTDNVYHIICSIFQEFSKDEKKINISEVIAAMCLLCRDPADQCLRASLHVFQVTLHANNQFSHADLVRLFTNGITMFNIDNSFELENPTEEEEDDENNQRILVRRKMSLDDRSQQQVSEWNEW